MDFNVTYALGYAVEWADEFEATLIGAMKLDPEQGDVTMFTHLDDYTLVNQHTLRHSADIEFFN